MPVDGRATVSMVLGILGLLLGLPLGVPGMVLGPLAYFLGKPAQSRIDASSGTIGGRAQAEAGWILGIVATAVGCVSALVWLIVILLSISTPSS